MRYPDTAELGPLARRERGLPLGLPRPSRRTINAVVEALEQTEDLAVKEIRVTRDGATVQMAGSAGAVVVEVRGRIRVS